MFQKPFRIKTQTAIKGSERKRLRADFGKRYECLSEEDLKNLVPNKDDMTVSKIMCHSGQQAIVYSVNGNPILFEVDSALYPTVYALWSYPSLVSLKFTTWPPVLQKLQGGADLMLPGVVLPKAAENAWGFPLGKFPKHQGCVVDLVHSSCCVAVGITALSSEDMVLSGMKGKGVIILHTYKDHLWAMGNKTDPPSSLFFAEYDGEDNDDIIADKRDVAQINSDEIDKHQVDPGSLSNALSDCTVTDKLDINSAVKINPEDSRLNEAAGGSDLLSVSKESHLQQNLADEFYVELTSKQIVEENTKSVNEQSLASSKLLKDNDEGYEETSPVGTSGSLADPQEMDKLLESCFLHALKLYRKKGELPVLTSTFFRNHIIPCCPQGQVLDMKKSSYKKLGKFLSAQQSEGIIKLKELTKGVESIVEIDFDHDKLRAFKIPEDTVGSAASAAETSMAASAISYTAPQIIELYLATAAVLPLFAGMPIKKGDPMSVTDIRHHITEYVKQNNLQPADNKGVVQLDPILSDLVLGRGENIELMKWEDVMPRVLSKMTRAYQITTTGSNPRTELRKGQPEHITLEVAQRGSNKKVTLVHNLELYGIDVEEFAGLIQKGVACSTSVSEDVRKNKGSQVCAQGNQINYIASLLTDKYQIPMKYIDGLQNAPKKKKK